MNEVDYLVNDLSLHGQFHDVAAFVRAVDTLMEIRAEIIRLGSALYCHRKLRLAQVTAEIPLPQAAQGLPIDKQRALMSWLGKLGPYWEDAQLHAGDEYLEVAGNVVTDTAVAEAAICISREIARELISFSPSDWLNTPIIVDWVREDGEREQIHVPNHWTIDSVKASLEDHPVGIDSWASLEAHLRHSCTRLTLSDDAFGPLQGYPFVVAASARIRFLLNTLNHFKGCFNESGERTREGHRLFASCFTGAAGLFSDSSASEKNEFREELTFRHPSQPGNYLFCPWHGKVRTPPFRIHFSWPITLKDPLHVVYIGPKITKR